MKRQHLVVAVLLFVLASVVVGADRNEKRARLPEFEASEVAQYFFPNVFARLLGERPGRPTSRTSAGTAPRLLPRYVNSKACG